MLCICCLARNTMPSKSTSPVLPFDGSTKNCPIFQVNGIKDPDANYTSPIKALKINFRFNQFFGIFPGSISNDWFEIKILKRKLILSFAVKAIFVSTILTLTYLWLQEQNMDFGDFLSKVTNHSGFTVTDTFAMVAHFLFLQFSALMIFFINLGLGEELTKLCGLVNDFNMKYQGQNPGIFKLMFFRGVICFLCTVASTVLFVGVRKIVAVPERDFNFLDFLILILIVFALYVENQNHQFSELLFLRFTDILDSRFDNFLCHLQQDHGKVSKGRPCCIDHGENIYKVYRGIANAFGGDLLVAITVIVISITFGVYLVLTFSIFVGISEEPILFATYILYTAIPSVRLYVLSEGAELTKRKMFIILDRLRKIEASVEADAWTSYEAKQFALTRMKFEKPKGYDAAGFFFLNRKFMAGVFGALMTYLIVLLQFKLSDSQLDLVKNSARA